MVSIGSKGLPRRIHISRNLTEDYLMDGEDNSYDQGRRKRSMNRKATKKRAGFGGDNPENRSSSVPLKTFKAHTFSRHQNDSKPQTSHVRKQVDAETAKYFSEISNVIEGTEIDFEERSAICGNALEETRGKEVELATDYIISHTLQTLLEGCSVDHLCSFLRSCSKDFPLIATDRSGSHVAESALKSLAMHLQDNETGSLIEDTLTTLCQDIVVNPFEVMCNCYGSHVLRSLLCLCKGVSLNSSEFHTQKSSMILAERLNSRPSRVDRNDSQHFHPGFPDLLKFLISEMLNAARKDIAILQVDQYSSLVLQTALKLLIGNEEELLHIIPILFGRNMGNTVSGNLIDITEVPNLLSLMKETAYSHLMEVLLEVSPETIYDELFTKVFRNSLYKMSVHHCGNFVVQALVSHARSQSHMEVIWEELGTKFKDLLEFGRSGVVASFIAASQRLHSHENKCCQAVAAAVCLSNEAPKCIVPRILFMDNYFFCEDKANWNWPNDVKMHVVGTLILQSVFRLPNEFIQAFITSITSLETDHALQAAKDSGGARVIEAFLGSSSSAKQKRKLVVKLRGHFGELSLHPSSSFTVEKCFNVVNLSLRETIVSELLVVQTELSKSKQGPHLLRRLDVDGYAKRPEQWKSRQASKESAYKEFYDTFGPKETKSSKNYTFLARTPHPSQPEKMKEMRKEIDSHLTYGFGTLSGSKFLANKSSTSKSKVSGIERPPESAGVLKSKHKRQKHKKGNGGIEDDVVRKTTEVHHEKSSKSIDKKGKKRHKEDELSKSSIKKMKV